MQKLMSLVMRGHGALGQGRRQEGFPLCSTVDPYSVDLDLMFSYSDRQLL